MSDESKAWLSALVIMTFAVTAWMWSDQRRISSLKEERGELQTEADRHEQLDASTQLHVEGLEAELAELRAALATCHIQIWEDGSYRALDFPTGIGYPYPPDRCTQVEVTLSDAWTNRAGWDAEQLG